MPILPLSTALREALPESVSDLYSRDVEPMDDSDIDRVIEEQRAQRERGEAAEAAGKRIPRELKAPTRAPRPHDIKIEGLVL